MSVSTILEKIKNKSIESDDEIRGFRFTITRNPKARKQAFYKNNKDIKFEILESGLSASEVLGMAGELHKILIREYPKYEYDAPEYRATLGGKKLENNDDEYHICLVLVCEYDQY